MNGKEDRKMDGWMTEGRIVGWMDGQIDRWMDVFIGTRTQRNSC